MKRKISRAHKSRSFLWWSIIILAILFGGFLLLVSLGFFEKYGISLKHFSPLFFLFTMALTNIMSYKRAMETMKKKVWAPFYALSCLVY